MRCIHCRGHSTDCLLILIPQPVLSACGVQKACCNASNILLFECMTDDSDKAPELFQIPSSGLASAGFCFIWRGLKRAEKLTAPLSMTILSARGPKLNRRQLLRRPLSAVSHPPSELTAGTPGKSATLSGSSLATSSTRSHSHSVRPHPQPPR